MENYLLRLQYIGRMFYGFQKQPNLPTVQGVLEETLSLLLQEKISISGSARTDRGVNALNQYANFYCNRSFEPEKLKDKLNGLLYKKGIFVKDLQAVDLNFHARRSAKGKIYAYLTTQDLEQAMFLFPYVYLYREPVEFGLLERAAQGIIGKHNFASFANVDRSQPERDTNCELFKVGIEKQKQYFAVYFYGNRFLYHMVRRLVYYLLKCSSGKVPSHILLDPFKEEKIPYSRQVLPPEPLFLVDVLFE